MLVAITAPAIAAGITMSPTMLMPKGRLAVAPINAPNQARAVVDFPTRLARRTISSSASLRVLMPSSVTRRTSTFPLDCLELAFGAVEIHWYEAHGVGKRGLKIKRFLDGTS